MREYIVDHGEDHEHVENDIPFSRRVLILAEAVSRRSELETRFDAEEFFNWNSYILPICGELASGSDRELDDSEVEMVLEAWVDFTHLLDIDHHHPFLSLDDCLAHVS